MTERQVLRPYLRVSKDRDGRSSSTDEQDDVLANAAQRHGWDYHPTPYLDRGLSASAYAGKPRPDFDALLSDLAAGTFDADLLGLYESSRGSREPADWEKLLKLARAAGVSFYVATHGRVYDPNNARDRRSLREDAVDSAYESDKTSERVKRHSASAVTKGRPWGAPPYGFKHEYDPLTGRLLGRVPHPEEAANVRDLFEKLADGWTLAAVARDWAERGVTTRRRQRKKAKRDGEEPPWVGGEPFTYRHLGHLATREAYAGRRTHHGRTVPAGWEPLVDPVVFDQVKAVVTHPSRRTTRAGSGTHLLTGTAKCGVCGAPLAVSWRGEKRPHLRCRGKGECVQVDEGYLDELANRAVVEYLSRPDVAKVFATPQSSPALRKVRNQLADARRYLDDLRERVKQRKVSLDTLEETEPALVQEVEDLQRRERELLLPPLLVGLAGTPEEVAARWAAAPLGERREVCRLLFSPEWAGTLVVNPVTDRAWCRHPDHGGKPVQRCLHRVSARVRLVKGS